MMEMWALDRLGRDGWREMGSHRWKATRGYSDASGQRSGYLCRAGA
jgi:hypothetical protein